MLVALGELETALSLLRSVTQDRSFYVRSRMLLARLLLQHKGDKRGYAQVWFVHGGFHLCVNVC